MVSVAHPEIEAVPSLEIPSWIKTLTFNGGEPLQGLFRDMTVFFPDYSSKAVDAAYLYKPSMYFQFDRDEFLNGSHSGVSGYFDFARDGFGPVCETSESY